MPMPKNMRLEAAARAYLAIVEWLEACPLANGQPYYEAANAELARLGQEALEAAPETHKADILAALEEADYGDRVRESEFWFWLAGEAEGPEWDEFDPDTGLDAPVND